ncbi:RHS repeat-associated core domain-containing protein, partial [Chryseobacterium polytrichastri]
YWKPGEIVETNNYYPFGLLHNYALTTQNAYQYKYNGKELQENGMYDYGARMYMPDLGRWGVVDPLAEKYRRWSPYNYAVNSPVRFIDPDGRFIIDPKATKEERAIIQRAINFAKSLIQDKKVLRSMMKWGQMSHSSILNDLTDGKGPVLNIKDLSGLQAFASYKGNSKGSGEFNLNSGTIDMANKLSGEDQSDLIFLIAVSILHEDVHRGDDVYGIDNPEEEGEKFEEEAFGESIQRNNSGDNRTKFNVGFQKILSDKFFEKNKDMLNKMRGYEEKKEKDNTNVKKKEYENIIKIKK